MPIRRSRAHEIERVLPSEAVQDGLQHEDTDRDAVPDEFVGDDGLNEEDEYGECHDLRQRDQIQLFEVLDEFVAVIPQMACITMPAIIATPSRKASTSTIAVSLESESAQCLHQALHLR